MHWESMGIILGDAFAIVNRLSLILRPKKYRLAAGYGRQELLKHLGSVTTMMLLSDNWPDFMTKLNRICPRVGTTYEMSLEEADR